MVVRSEPGQVHACDGLSTQSAQNFAAQNLVYPALPARTHRLEFRDHVRILAGWEQAPSGWRTVVASDIFCMASAICTSLNSGKWKSPSCLLGVHHANTGHIPMPEAGRSKRSLPAYQPSANFSYTIPYRNLINLLNAVLSNLCLPNNFLVAFHIGDLVRYVSAGQGRNGQSQKNNSNSII